MILVCLQRKSTAILESGNILVNKSEMIGSLERNIVRGNELDHH